MPHRICHISTAHSTYDTRVFQKECVSLANAGFDTHLVVQGIDELKDGVHIHGLRRPVGRLDRMTKLVDEAYQIAVGINADLYHLHDPELLRIALKLKRDGKIVVFDSHEFYRYQIAEKEYLSKAIAKTASLVYGWYETHVCSRIDAVIIPCTKGGANPFNNCARRTAIVDNYPILSVSEVPPQFTRIKRDSVCYVGSLTRSRGITQFVLAAHSAGVRAILAGPISDDYKKELQAMPEYECVDYRGVLDRAGVESVIAECFCGTAALLDVGQYWAVDNLPTKAYEYMAGGIPFIMSPTPFAKQFVDDYPCCQLANPEDIIAYAGAIRALRDNPDNAYSMAKVGYKALTMRFNWHQEEQRLFGLYEDLLKTT